MKKKIIIITTLFIICITIFIVVFTDKKVNEINVIKSTENIVIKISYPVFNNKIDKKIKKHIKNMENDFDEIKKSNSKDYQLLIEYTLFDYKNIKSIELNSYVFNGEKYIKNSKSINYNIETKCEVNLDYFFKFDDYKNNLKTIINNDTVDINNFKFTEDGLELYKKDFETSFVLPFAEINYFLKDEFIKTNEEFNIDISSVSKRDISAFKDKKLIALTFDDGPNSSITEKLLTELSKRNAKATFFVMGSRVKYNKDILKRTYLEGHQIGSHSYSHKILTNLKENQLLNEINKTNEEIEKVIGVKPIIIRPPYGHTNKNIKLLSRQFNILWDVDTMDWKYKNSDKIAKKIVKKVHDGSVVLLHDIYYTSVLGAIKAIDILKEDGYEFVTIDEMCELKNIKLNLENTYFNF